MVKKLLALIGILGVVALLAGAVIVANYVLNSNIAPDDTSANSLVCQSFSDTFDGPQIDSRNWYVYNAKPPTSKVSANGQGMLELDPSAENGFISIFSRKTISGDFSLELDYGGMSREPNNEGYFSTFNFGLWDNSKYTVFTLTDQKTGGTFIRISNGDNPFETQLDKKAGKLKLKIEKVKNSLSFYFGENELPSKPQYVNESFFGNELTIALYGGSYKFAETTGPSVKANIKFDNFKLLCAGTANTTNPSVTLTPTVTFNPAASATPTVSPSPTASPSPTQTSVVTTTPSKTPTPTVTTSISVTPTVTTSGSVTPTVTVTPGVTSTVTITPTPVADTRQSLAQIMNNPIVRIALIGSGIGFMLSGVIMLIKWIKGD